VGFVSPAEAPPPVIPYDNEHSGLRDWRTPIVGTEKPPSRGPTWVVVIAIVAAVITAVVLYLR